MFATIDRLFHRKRKSTLHVLIPDGEIFPTKLPNEGTKVYHDESYSNKGYLFYKGTRKSPRLISSKGFVQVYKDEIVVLGKSYPFSDRIVEILDGHDGSKEFSVIRDEHNNIYYVQNGITPICNIPFGIGKIINFERETDSLYVLIDGRVSEIYFIERQAVLRSVIYYNNARFSEVWTMPGFIESFWGLTFDGDALVGRGQDIFNIGMRRQVEREGDILIPNFAELKPKKIQFDGYSAGVYLLTHDGYLYTLPTTGNAKYFFHLVEKLNDRFIMDICTDSSDENLNIISRKRTSKDPGPPPKISFKTAFGATIELA